MVLIMGLFDALSSPLINLINASGKIKMLQISIFIINISVIPISILFLKMSMELTVVYVMDMIAVFWSYITRILVSWKYTAVELGDYLRHLLLPVLTIILSLAAIYAITEYYGISIDIGFTIILEVCYLAVCVYQYRSICIELLTRIIQINRK